jgi:hypothetical protein
MLSSIGSNSLESSAGQDITVFTRYLVARFVTASPGADQVLFDARSDGTKSVRLFTDNSDSDQWALDAGGTPIVVSGTYDNNFHVFTIVSNGSTSLLRVSDVGEIEGDPGSEELDYGTLMSALDGSLSASVEVGRDIISSTIHTDAEQEAVEAYLKSNYNVVA